MHKKFCGILQTAVLYIALASIGITMLAPFLWMISTSLKINSEIFSYPLLLLPKKEWDFANYVEVSNFLDFERVFLVTTIATVSAVVSNLLFCSMAGYTFSKLNFPGRDLLFLGVLATLMIPFQAIVVPLFVLIARFPLVGGNNFLGQGGSGLVNTFPGLILPQLVSAFGIFLLRQFFQTVPDELRDAAKIDGSSEFGIYWKIFLPLCRPGLAALGIFTFLGVWNNFMWPLVVANTPQMRVVQVAISSLREQYSTDWAYLMASSIMAILPVLTVFLVGQKYFIRGISITGIKA